jgi:hypothetical protein
MKKVILATCAAALLVAPALAQNIQPLNQQGAPEGQLAAPVTPVDIDTVIAAANNMQAEVVGLGDFQDATKIFVLSTAEFLAGARGPDLTSALQKDESEFQALRAALQANPTILAELERSNVTVDQVVAVDLTDAGELLIFVQSG